MGPPTFKDRGEGTPQGFNSQSERGGRLWMFWERKSMTNPVGFIEREREEEEEEGDREEREREKGERGGER